MGRNRAWRDQKAVSLARRAYELEPANADVADTLAMALVRTGDQKEALRLLEGAVRASPEKPIIRFHFAQVLSESGDRDAAILELRKLLAQDDFPERDQAEELLAALTQ